MDGHTRLGQQFLQGHQAKQRPESPGAEPRSHDPRSNCYVLSRLFSISSYHHSQSVHCGLQSLHSKFTNPDNSTLQPSLHLCTICSHEGCSSPVFLCLPALILRPRFHLYSLPQVSSAWAFTPPMYQPLPSPDLTRRLGPFIPHLLSEYLRYSPFSYQHSLLPQAAFDCSFSSRTQSCEFSLKLYPTSDHIFCYHPG